MIDFGDLGAGDPAFDVATAWLLLPHDTTGRLRSSLVRTVRGGLPALGRDR